MSTTDYLLNGVLIALVVLQLRGRQLTARNLLLPVAVAAYIGHEYLHGVPTAGNDLTLEVIGATAGVVLGAGCGLATAVFRRADGATIAKAGPTAAVLWVAGIGARLAFELYSTHGGGAAIGRFSVAHDITTAEAWVACLVLMAVCEVLARTATISLKFWRASARAHEVTVLPTIPPVAPSSSIMDARDDG